MSLQEVIDRSHRLPRKQLSELANAIELRSKTKDMHRLSQPKPRINLIKINRHKLPTDFFPRKDFSARKSSHKAYFREEQPDLGFGVKKADSERIHYTPEKTSFFGFMEEKEPLLQISGGYKFFNRKFQTRDEPKRDLFPLEPTRKLNTASKNAKNDLLELFPPAYNNELNEFLTNSSKSQFLRGPLRREVQTKQREPIFLDNPQKGLTSDDKDARSIVNSSKDSVTTRDRLNSHNLSISEQQMTITFYNAKSNCFPPISRSN